jgi:hypothetical protein
MNPDADIDADIRAAIASSKGDDSGPAHDSTADVGGQSSDVGGDVSATEPGAAARVAADDGAAEPAISARTRDASGRFAPKGKAATQTTTQTKAPKEVTGAPSPTDAIPPTVSGDSSKTLPPQPGAQSETLRPPQSWTPAAREAFAKAPPEVQREVAKREREIAAALQEAAPTKRFRQEVEQAFAPFQEVARTLGVQNPIALGVQAAQVATRIATGPAHIAAREIAQLIQSRPDLQLDLINAHLSGEAGQRPTQPQAFDPEMVARQAEERVFQRLQQQREQHLAVSVQQEIAEFDADPANEYAQDPRVRGLMSAILRNPLYKGSIKDAYQQALWANDDTRAILQQRAAAEQAKASQASTQRARAAATSIQSQPAAAPQGAPKDDLDSTIRAALGARNRR